MTKYYIIHMPQFRKELDNIEYYLANVLCSPLAASNLLNKVINLVSCLALFPERYSKIFVSNKFKNRNLRKIPVDNYIIIYEVDNSSHEVFILHIFHGSQNYLYKL